MESKKDQEAKLVIVTGFLALSVIFGSKVLAWIALSLGIAFLISTNLSKLILAIWWKIAHLLGWINTRILLSLIFYIFLFPIALLSRIFTSDPLSIRWKKKTSSFTLRDHTYVPADLENPW